MSSQNQGKEEPGACMGDIKTELGELEYQGEACRVCYLGIGLPYGARTEMWCLVTRQGAQDLGQTQEYLGLEDQGISLESRGSEWTRKRRPRPLEVRLGDPALQVGRLRRSWVFLSPWK